MLADEWVKEFQAAISVCDAEGNLLALNDRAIQLFEKEGGETLVGTNIVDCHPEPERTKFKGMLRSEAVNCYILEKPSVKKLILQAPWYRDGAYRGYVEFVIEIPFDVPRKKVV